MKPFALEPDFNPRLYDLGRLLIEASFPHRSDVDRYLVNTISAVIRSL